MNLITFDLFPGGNHHCVTMSYDDGQQHDIRLAEIFRQNGLVGTFHLNASTLHKPGFVKASDIKEIYCGHEVSCHMAHHPFPRDIPDVAILSEILAEKRELERACGYVVRGMSYPYGEYDARVISLCRTAGMEYSRTVESTNSFSLPKDFLAWHPTCYHKYGLMDNLERFYAPDPFHRMRLLYVWGHSYEFHEDDNWSLIEEFAKSVAHRSDTWYASNIEIVDYVNALRSLRIGAEQSMVYNPSALTVYFSINGDAVSVAPSETFSL